MTATAAFETRTLSFRYPHASSDALREVSIVVPRGSFCAVIGPNGSGKSTLLRLLLGVEQPTAGGAYFEGVPAASWDRTSIAREIGVVTQSEDVVFPVTVRDLVAMGRYPHLGSWRREGEADREAIEDALDFCALTAHAGRLVSSLSGGERQRARIARALAQRPRTFVLDEPTAALDIAHEMAIFELMARLARQEDAAVLFVTHNINLAARYASHLVLLENGALAAQGPPSSVITHDRIATAYHWPVSVRPYAGNGPDAGAPQVSPLRKEDM
jgi:iron complex transport system ATP-binding protein